MTTLIYVYYICIIFIIFLFHNTYIPVNQMNTTYILKHIFNKKAPFAQCERGQSQITVLNY
jgi:hypothetical protein